MRTICFSVVAVGRTQLLPIKYSLFIHCSLLGSYHAHRVALSGSLHPWISLSLTSSSMGTGACQTRPPPVSAAHLNGRSCYLTVHPVQEGSHHLRSVSYTGACVFCWEGSVEVVLVTIIWRRTGYTFDVLHCGSETQWMVPAQACKS